MYQPKGRLFSRALVSSDTIAEFCQRWKIMELSLFGSVLRDHFSRDSDIDMLVSFKQGSVPGLRF